MNMKFLVASFDNISALFVSAAKAELLSRLMMLGYECKDQTIKNHIYIGFAPNSWKFIAHCDDDYVLNFHKDRGSEVFDMAKPNDVAGFLVRANEVSLFYKERILEYRGVVITIRENKITVNADALLAEAKEYAQTQI